MLQDVLSRAFAEADPQVCTSKRQWFDLLLRPDTLCSLSVMQSTAQQRAASCTQ